ncbi:MAG: 2Fe-2S iron-sulfur cluster-binding protein [Sphingobium sp.]
MVKLTFESSSGEAQTVDGQVGESVMRVGLNNGIGEIIGECGGGLSCATCHVFVDPGMLDLLPPMSEMEDELLDGAMTDRRPNSRLSCQIPLSPDLDGLRVATPERQM